MFRTYAAVLGIFGACLPLVEASRAGVPAQDATARCTVRNCLCEVIPDPRPARHSPTSPRNQVLQDRVIVYFGEDQSALDSRDIRDIETFLARKRGEARFTVIGYADTCGESDYNAALGEKRADSAASLIHEKSPGVRVQTLTRGESASSAHHEFFRRVEILSSTALSAPPRGSGWMLGRLEECRQAGADFYLIDGSGSMEPYWGEVLSFAFPTRAEVRLSIMTGCSDGVSLPAVRPTAGTEIWYSYWKVIDQMKYGQTLCIVSDFNSNVPLSSSEAALIEQKARKKGINVHAIRY